MRIASFLCCLWLLGAGLAPSRSLAQVMLHRPCPADSAKQWEWNPPVAGPQPARLLPRPAWNSSPDSVQFYLACENRLVAPAPARGRQAPIRFTATGATLTLDAKQRQLVLLPTSTAVTLWAHKGRKQLFKHDFDAVPPPLPTIECYISKRSESTDEKAVGPSSLLLKAVPDRCFALRMPDEARYRVARFQVTLLRNNVPVDSLQTIVGPTTNWSELEGRAHPGDRLRVGVQAVQRLTSYGKIEDLLLEKQFTFSFP